MNSHDENAHLKAATDAEGRAASPQLPDEIKNFLIDIDGTITEDVPNEQPERMATCAPFPDALETLNRWYAEGHVITFFTSRTEEHREVTEAWFEEHGFQYHGLLMGKPRGRQLPLDRQPRRSRHPLRGPVHGAGQDRPRKSRSSRATRRKTNPHRWSRKRCRIKVAAIWSSCPLSRRLDLRMPDWTMAREASRLVWSSSTNSRGTSGCAFLSRSAKARMGSVLCCGGAQHQPRHAHHKARHRARLRAAAGFRGQLLRGIGALGCGDHRAAVRDGHTDAAGTEVKGDVAGHVAKVSSPHGERDHSGPHRLGRCQKRQSNPPGTSRNCGQAAATREAVEAVIDGLDRGVLRCAEPVEGGWQVNEWVKKAVVLYFPMREMKIEEVGPFQFHDKMALKRNHAEAGVRVVPHAIARYGAFLGKGVVMMPSYVNIGAYVGGDHGGHLGHRRLLRPNRCRRAPEWRRGHRRRP